jgi:hypothetical protein
MADEATTDSTTEGADQTSVDTSSDAQGSATDAGAEQQGEAALGDAGKKALDAMKAKWKEADRLAKENATALAALQAKLDGKDAEHQAAQEAQRIKDDALAAANERILKAEIRAAAKGKVADEALADLSALMNLSDLEVGSDGEVDASQIAQAIDDLIASKPYLAAQRKRFEGSADGGARNGATQPTQLSEADVKRLYAEKKYGEIDQAKKDGRLNDYLGIK